MNDFDYVRTASNTEIDKFFSDLASERRKKYSKSLDILNHYKDAIFAEFELIMSEYARKSVEYPIKVSEFYQEVERLIEERKCTCGGNLRLIDGLYGEFWGCSNYKDETVKHQNYMDNAHIWVPFQKPSVLGWAASIRSRLNLPRSLPTGCIYTFILNSGYEDISELYHGISERTNVYKLVDTRKKATEFELKELERLKKTLDKISFQLPIRYKFNGNQQEKFAFPDIVGSNTNTVYIYECKTNKSDVDIYQKELYTALITQIIKDKGINKRVVHEFLFENL